MLISEPLICTLCHEYLLPDEAYICEACWKKVKRVYEPKCVNCGRPLGDSARCLQCQGRHYHFQAVYSWGLYDGELQAIIQQFKYQKKIVFGRLLMSRMIAEMPFLQALETDLIVPVPLHARKMVKRGFNQTAILSSVLAKASGQKIVRALLRHRGVAQAGHSNIERSQTIRNQFYLDRRLKKKISGMKILLVDDVFTTGSTADECSKVLLAGGAQQVIILTVATTMLNRSNR